MDALILIDLQNDFLPGGALAVPRGDEVIDTANRLMTWFDLVIATQDWHPAHHRSFAAEQPGKNIGDRIDLAGLPQVLWPVHCVQGSSGADFAPGLDRARITHVIKKGIDPDIDSYSGFFDNGHRRSTGLGEYLRERGVEGVTLMGLATDYCVKATALDARKLGLKTTLVLDGCRGVELSPGDVERSLDEMRAAGVLFTSLMALVSSRQPLDEMARGRFLRLVRRGHWEYVDRVNTSGAVMVVAVTDEGRLLLTEQYRIPLSQNVIELPAGLVGDDPGTDGEPGSAAARRELLEETGYVAERMEYLTAGPSSAGLATEQVAIYLATNLKKTSSGGGTEHEQITVHEVPLGDVPGWLEERQKREILVDPRIFAALYFLMRVGNGHR